MKFVEYVYYLLCKYIVTVTVTLLRKIAKFHGISSQALDISSTSLKISGVDGIYPSPHGFETTSTYP